VIDPVADHYLLEKITSATPAELIAMLYDKAVLSLKRAQQFLTDGKHDLAHGRIVNASDIVLELRSVLNPEAGDMTVRLEALYAWVTTRLLVAASRRDSGAVQEALDVLQPLQSAWREACVGAGAPMPAAAVPAQR
jgi:flagellar protein FliS